MDRKTFLASSLSTLPNLTIPHTRSPVPPAFVHCLRDFPGKLWICLPDSDPRKEMGQRERVNGMRKRDLGELKESLNRGEMQGRK